MIAWLEDRLKNLAPVFKPMKSKPETNSPCARDYPCFAQDVMVFHATFSASGRISESVPDSESDSFSLRSPQTIPPLE